MAASTDDEANPSRQTASAEGREVYGDWGGYYLKTRSIMGSELRFLYSLHVWCNINISIQSIHV